MIVLKIAHLLPAHPIFQNRMLRFLQNYFRSYNFELYIIQLNETKVSLPDDIYAKVVRISTPFSSHSQNIEIIDLLKEYDIIVFHSLSLPVNMKMYIGLLHQKLINKIVWIEWGYDLYLEQAPGIKGKIIYNIKALTRRFFEKYIPYFIAIHPADVESYHKIIKGKAKVYVALYRSSNNVEPSLEHYTKITIHQRIQNNEELLIQVNHRADRILNHKKILNYLKKYRDNNIKLFIPLCYGDKEYGDEIEDYAKCLFGDKVICPRDVIPYNDYMKILERVDIFVLNSERQIGLGNIHPMIRMEKKIYMPNTSVLFQYFRKISPAIQDVKQLEAESFLQLCEDVDMDMLRDHVNEYLSVDSPKVWKDVFDKIIIDYIGCEENVN